MLVRRDCCYTSGVAHVEIKNETKSRFPDGSVVGVQADGNGYVYSDFDKNLRRSL